MSNSGVQVPIEFAEAQYLRGLEQGSKSAIDISSMPARRANSNMKEWIFPGMALMFSIVFLSFNLFVFNSGKGSPTSPSVLGDSTTTVPSVRAGTTIEQYRELVEAKIAETNTAISDNADYLDRLEADYLNQINSSGNKSATYQEVKESLLKKKQNLQTKLSKLQNLERSLSTKTELSEEDKLILLSPF